MAKRKLKSKNSKKTKLRDFFYLNCKKALFVFILLILMVVFHTFSYELFRINEPVIFLIAIILLILYIVKAGVYTRFHQKIHKNL